MFTTARLDRPDVAALLLDLGMSPDVGDASGARAPHMAAGCNSLGVTKLLVERGADIELRQVLSAEPEREKEMHWGKTLLFCLPADERSTLEVVELLLASGTDPAIRNSTGLSAEEHARKEGFEDVAALLRANSG